MANYYGTVRTNYFRVTDESEYQRLFEGLCSEDTIQDFSNVNHETGELWHGFGSYSTIDYFPGINGKLVNIDDDDDPDEFEEEPYDEDGDPNFDLFLEGMQKIIHPDDAFILMEVGNEKLRYLIGAATVVTRRSIDGIDLESAAIDCAQKLLGNPNYQTKLQY